MSRRGLTEEEILDATMEIDSDFELSDNDCEPTDLVSDTDSEPELNDENDTDFQSSWSPGPFIPIVYEFEEFASGVNPDTMLTENSPIIDFFEHFLSRKLMESIVNETNKFFQYNMRTKEFKDKSRIHKWVDTTIEEMYVYFSLSMLMTRNRHLTVEEHWSTDILILSPIFGRTMPRDRYELLSQLLHFCDSEVQAPSDRLYKIRLLVEHTRNIFKNTMMPNKNLCIDESIIVFKGRLMFKQYIPSKRHRFGIKMFVLCDVETGYILDFIIYVGKETEINNDNQGLGISGSVVTTLLADYIGKGHTLWCDNWYSSPNLFKFLHEQKTNACGTVRKNRKNMPIFSKLKKGEIKSQHSGPLMVIKWHDRREVHMLTTLHDDSKAPTGKTDRTTGQQIEKPVCVLDYNRFMGSVDKADMMLSTLSCMRKSVKWYKKVAFHIIDLYLLNAHILYQKITGKKISLADFHLSLNRQLLEKYVILPTPTCRPTTSSDNPLRLASKSIAKHMPVVIPPTEKVAKPRRRCRVCATSKIKNKVRKQTQFMCLECNVSLCPKDCFKLYHDLKKF